MKIEKCKLSTAPIQRGAARAGNSQFSIFNFQFSISPRRPAFTLLEVLLSLGLTMLVLMAVGMTVDFYLRGIESSRANVEEAQLARALLRRIADDLRSAVRYDPMNAEKLMPDISTPDLSGKGTGNSQPNQGPAAPPTGNPGDDPPAADDSTASDSSGPSTITGLPQSMPGLFGTRNELQVDVSRLPRLDQYDEGVLPMGDSPLVDRLSDVKTISYFVLDGGAPGQPEKRGLMRSELDRAVTAHAAEVGDLLDLAYDSEPIAPEVAGVEFEYFDGSQWLDTWDSIQQQGLPVAVRVTLYMLPSDLRGAPSPWRESPEISLADQGLMTFSLLIHMPSSEPTNLEDQWGEDDASSGGGTSGSSGSGSGSGSTSKAGAGTQGTGSGSKTDSGSPSTDSRSSNSGPSSDEREKGKRS